MEKSKIITNRELQEGISKHLGQLEEPECNLNVAKAYFSGAGKLLAAVKRDMEAATHVGVPFRSHTRKFLSLDEE